MAMTTWNQTGDLEDFLLREESGLIFKHSTRCSISSEAEKEFERFLESHSDVPVYRVLVVENRATSIAVAEKVGVPHASPQAILVQNGVVSWSASHWDITADALARAWSGDHSV